MKTMTYDKKGILVERKRKPVTVKWVQDRIRGKHHAVLAKYLARRSEEARKEASELGLDANSIISIAFDVKNGQTEVPKCAIKVMRCDPTVDPLIVWHLCEISTDKQQRKEFVRQARRMIAKGVWKNVHPKIQEILDLASVQEVLEI